MPNFQDFIRDNNPVKQYSGKLGVPFAVLDAKAVLEADNKVKALTKSLIQLTFWKPLLAVGMVGAFNSLSKSIRTVLADTGSLNAALQKLATIQNYQRLFAPFVGGVDAAKKKVAELVNFASTSPFKFPAIAEAARSLQIFTRGTFSTIQNLKAVGDAAAKSGNGITETADAIAEFYGTLRAGIPIDNAAEKLRQMGVITQQTSDHLKVLQENGAGVQQIFGELTSALSSSVGGMDAMKDSVQGVNEAYEKAQDNLREKFGSPFVDRDVQTTKNYTDALNAVAPVVGRVAAAWAGWRRIQGGDQLKSWLAKSISENPQAQGAAEFVGKGLPVAGAAATIGASTYLAALLPAWISQFASFTQGQGAAGAAAMRGRASSVGLGTLEGRGLMAGATGLESATGAISKFSGVVSKAATAYLSWKAVSTGFSIGRYLGEQIPGIEKFHNAISSFVQDTSAKMFGSNSGITQFLNAHMGGEISPEEQRLVDLQNSLHDTTEAFLEQAKAIQTVEDRNEAYAKGLATIKQLQEQLNSATTDSERRAISGSINAITRLNANVKGTTNLYSEQDVTQTRQRIEVARDTVDRQFREHLANAPEGSRARWQGGIAARASIQAMDAASGAKARLDMQKATIGMSAEESAQYIVSHAPSTSSIYAEAQATLTKNPAMRAKLQGAAQDRATQESNAPQLAGTALAETDLYHRMQAEDSIANIRMRAEEHIQQRKFEGALSDKSVFAIQNEAMEAELKVIEARKDLQPNEKAILESRIRASQIEAQTNQDFQITQAQLGLRAKQAEVSGRSGESLNLRHLSEFLDIYQKDKQFMSPQEARAASLAEEHANITGELQQSYLAVAPVVDSLQSIGGGGRAAYQGSSLSDILKKANDYLEEIAKNTDPDTGKTIKIK